MAAPSADQPASAGPGPRFVLGVDIDGVVADYSAGFAQYVAERRGLDPAALPQRHAYGFGEWGLDSDEYEQLHYEAVVNDRLLARLPPIEGAADELWRLSDANVWIRVITHRLYVNWGHAEAVTDTVTWLDQHSIPYRDICFLGDKPEVEANCYIDDAPINVEALRASGNYVIVFAQSYNEGLDPPRASNWSDVKELVVNRLAQWRGHRGVAEQLPGIDAGVDRLQRRRSVLRRPGDSRHR